MTEKGGFELKAHFLGTRRSVSAEPDGLGWLVQTESGQRRASSLEQAIRIAEQHVGELLRRVGNKPGWGLRVSAGNVAASYGDPDPLEVSFPGGGQADPDSLVARIYATWNPGSGPAAALQNALKIVRAYLGRSGRSKAA